MLLNFPDRTRRGVSNHRMNASYHCCKTRRYIYPKHTGAEARKYISVVCLSVGVCVCDCLCYVFLLSSETDRQTDRRGESNLVCVVRWGPSSSPPFSQTQSHTHTDTHTPHILTRRRGGETEGETVGPNHTHTHTQRETHTDARARERVDRCTQPRPSKKKKM